MCACQFFQKRGVSEALSIYELFNAVSGLNVPFSEDKEEEFLTEVGGVNGGRVSSSSHPMLMTCVCVCVCQIMVLEKRNEDHVQKRKKKSFAVAPEDGDPPLQPDADD